MSERVWEQTGPGSACRSCVCQLVLIPPSFFLLFPFETPTPSRFLKIRGRAAQLLVVAEVFHALLVGMSAAVMQLVMLPIQSSEVSSICAGLWGDFRD